MAPVAGTTTATTMKGTALALDQAAAGTATSRMAVGTN